MEDIMNLLVGGDDTVDVLAESLKADRKLILNGEVDSWCVEEICMQIMKWNQDDKDIMPEKRKKIYLLINTPGGDAFSGMNMLDVITCSETPVVTIGYGMCCSMGFYLLCAGKERYCFPNTIVLLHDGSNSIQTTSRKGKDIQAFYDKLDEKLQEFDRSLTEVPKKNNQKRYIAMGAIGAVAVIVALYLVLSITGAFAWSVSWLLPLGAIVAAVVAADVVLLLKGFKSDKFLVARLFNVATVILVFVFMYLCIRLSVHPRFDWYIFLCMVPAAGIMDIAIGFVTKSKLTVPEIFVWAMLTSVMLYVMLGVAAVMPWHPGWLLPALTAICIVAVVAVLLISHSKKAKKDKQLFLDSTKNQVDEEYYTKW